MSIFENYHLELFFFSEEITYLLQYLYGAQELRIVNPFTFFMQRFRVNLRGNENIRPSFRLHFLCRRVDLQHFFIYIY